MAEHRASDAEREATAQRLQTAAADGRLDPEELDQRLTEAYGARTVGELATLTADLPAAQPPPPKPEPAWRSEAVRARLASFIVANVVCIAVWVATGSNDSFWPKWVLLATGIGLIAVLVRGALGVEDVPEGRRIERHRRRLGP